MTMSEFETLLSRIDGVAEKVDVLARAFAVHCARDSATRAAVADVGGKRSKWIDRAWTLGVCLVGIAGGYLLKR